MISKYLVSLLALAASAPLAKSVPAAATVPIAWTPKILYPHNGTVWYIGSIHHVVWDASKPPSKINDTFGSIYLKDNSTQFEEQLAGGFNLSDGRVLFQVRDDIAAGKYQVVLIGGANSTTSSDEFTIARRYW